MVASIFRGPKAAAISVELIRAFARQQTNLVGPPPEPGKRMFDAIRDAFLMKDSEAQFATELPVTYFLQAGTDGPIKIGSTRNLAVRLRTLATMSPVPLTLLAVVPDDIELECHEKLQPWRLHGEWFAPTTAVLAFIRERADVRTRRAGANPRR